MTFREKLKLEHPDKLYPEALGGCEGCPCDYGYEESRPDLCTGQVKNAMCSKCWDREIPTDEPATQNQKSCRDCRFRFRNPDHFPCPLCERGSYWSEEPVNHVDEEVIRKKPMTQEERELHDREINAEILDAYCDQQEYCFDCPAYAACFRAACFRAGGKWGRPDYNIDTQLAVLRAFEDALPPEELSQTDENCYTCRFVAYSSTSAPCNMCSHHIDATDPNHWTPQPDQPLPAQTKQADEPHQQLRPFLLDGVPTLSLPREMGPYITISVERNVTYRFDQNGQWIAEDKTQPVINYTGPIIDALYAAQHPKGEEV